MIINDLLESGLIDDDTLIIIGLKVNGPLEIMRGHWYYDNILSMSHRSFQSMELNASKNTVNIFI